MDMTSGVIHGWIYKTIHSYVIYQGRPALLGPFLVLDFVNIREFCLAGTP